MIHWCIILKERWDNFPPAEQIFDIFYNKLSKYVSNYKTLLSGSNRSSRIGALNTQGGGEHECGRGRGRDRGHGRGRGQGRGRVRGRGRGRGHNPYSLSCPYGNGTFNSEAKIYDKGQYQSLYQDKQTGIE